MTPPGFEWSDDLQNMTGNLLAAETLAPEVRLSMHVGVFLIDGALMGRALTWFVWNRGGIVWAGAHGNSRRFWCVGVGRRCDVERTLGTNFPAPDSWITSPRRRRRIQMSPRTSARVPSPACHGMRPHVRHSRVEPCQST